MAGSYRHVTGDNGAFIGTDHIENGGDAYEAIEELYGMIWWLANGDRDRVEEARKNYMKGLELAPKRENTHGED